MELASTIESPHDLTTKQYVDDKINTKFQAFTNVCNDNTILQNELKNYYSEYQIIQSNTDFTTKLYIDTQISAMTNLLTKIIQINTDLQLQIAKANLN